MVCLCVNEIKNGRIHGRVRDSEYERKCEKKEEVREKSRYITVRSTAFNTDGLIVVESEVA